MDEVIPNYFIKSRGGYGGGGNGGSGGGTKCGRWNPTTEQVKVLSDLFRSGLRTPNTDQIQKISNQLSFYGKIESKNVFYWFQNHKARERQKRRRVTVVDDELKENRCEEKKESSLLCSRKSSNAFCAIENIPQVIELEEINEVPDGEKTKETLQLFPLNSFNEFEYSSEKLRLFTNDQSKGIPSFPYNAVGPYDMHPTLDLRLSFL